MTSWGNDPKTTCAYCNGKNGRHEQRCKRVEGEDWWSRGLADMRDELFLAQDVEADATR